jgi:hypothetical protein
LCQPAYKVSTLNNTQTATDPLTKTAIDGATIKDFNLATKFGITGIAVAGGDCRIAFDNMGRPYGFTTAGLPTEAFTGLLTADTVITLTHPDGTATITVVDETGYVSVDYATP